jgi:phage gpG-like protein
MSITVTIAGGDALVAKLASLPDALSAQLGAAFALIADQLYAQVEENLSGAVVNSISGKLRAAITEDSDNASATVGLDSDAAPYGAALEFGASIPAQLIEAKNAKALAFVVGGSQVFAKHVMHPAFVLPPHSFLGAALADLAPDAVAMLEDAVAEAIAS